MTPLHEAFAEHVAFDDKAESDAAIHFYAKMNCCPQDDRHSFVEGAKHESARLAPALAAVGKLIEAAEALPHQGKQLFEALRELREVVEGK